MRRILRLALIIAAVLPHAISIPAYGINDCDRHAVLYDTVFYDDCTSDAGGATPAGTPHGDPNQDANRQFAFQYMQATYGWGQDQFDCLDALWNRESGWNEFAINDSPAATGALAYSVDKNRNHILDNGEYIPDGYDAAYGIPQAKPGSKMSTAGADWRTNPQTQIKWGLQYFIDHGYKNPCGGWAHSQATGWY